MKNGMSYLAHKTLDMNKGFLIIPQIPYSDASILVSKREQARVQVAFGVSSQPVITGIEPEPLNWILWN